MTMRPCSLVNVYICFRGTCRLHLRLKMEEVFISETSVKFYQTTSLYPSKHLSSWLLVVWSREGSPEPKWWLTQSTRVWFQRLPLPPENHGKHENIHFYFVLLNESITCFKVRCRTKLVTLNSSWPICADGATGCLDSGLDMNYIISYNHDFLGCDAVYLGHMPEGHALNIQHRTNIKYCNGNLPLEFLGQSHMFSNNFTNFRVWRTTRV